MKIPTYARYDYCNRKACEFLEEYDIKSFPIDVEKIIYNSGWGLSKYSELMSVFSCDLETVIRCLRSKDGYTQLADGNYSISYNDSAQLGNRKRFTLMHEVGHIYLNHLVDFEATRLSRCSLSKQEYKVLENEANAFARNVLVPTGMLTQLKNKEPYNISQKFGITVKAAETRLDFYYEDLRLNTANGILPRLTKIFLNYCYKKRCYTCGYSTVTKNINYCPICGKKTFVWGDNDMTYPKIETHNNRKLKKCPICENEETEVEGNFCQICSTYLINECSNIECGSELPTNARYCPLCGDKSLFLINGILKPWNYSEYISDGFSNIPDASSYKEDDIDIPLPFN